MNTLKLVLLKTTNILKVVALWWYELEIVPCSTETLNFIKISGKGTELQKVLKISVRVLGKIIMIIFT